MKRSYFKDSNPASPFQDGEVMGQQIASSIKQWKSMINDTLCQLFDRNRPNIKVLFCSYKIRNVAFSYHEEFLTLDNLQPSLY